LTGGAGKALVHLLQVSLQALLNLLFERGEFNSHPNAWVASPNYSAGFDLVGVNPEGNEYAGTDAQGNQGLDVAATSAYIGGSALHVSALSIWEANGERELNFVTSKTALLCSVV
jgi:hypothetical protein